MLTRIEFENFRGFRQLTLDGLQRVNLIVGKNNSGKTSLLEGAAALLSPNDAAAEFSRFRQLENELQGRFQEGQYANWVVLIGADDGIAHLSGCWDDSDRNVFLVPVETLPGVVYPQSEKPEPGAKARRDVRQLQDSIIRMCIISARPRQPEDLVQTFGKAIRRRHGEELLETTLRAVDPRIKKIRIAPVEYDLQVVIDIGLPLLVPISQVGQGVYRLVELFSEMVGADARVAFVDELENGIHHTCLIDVWRGIAEAAQQFNVQVFVTTHSHECIEAAHAAFNDRTPYDFAIIQLFRESGLIQGRVLDQEHIAAAIAGDIDLRA